MRRALILACGLAACEGPPERPDPLDFPSVVEDTGLERVVNTCRARSYDFQVESRGYVAEVFDGLAEYTYDPATQQTTIVLTGCSQGRDQVISLPFYGASALGRGYYDVQRQAPEEGGFLFSYADESETAPIRCADKPEGTVVITRVDGGRVKGRFDVYAKCDDGIADPRERTKSRFRGTFEALDITPYL